MFGNKQVRHGVSKRYLLCPAALTIRHLKKLITSKLDVTPQYQVCLQLPSGCSLPSRKLVTLAIHMSMSTTYCKSELGISVAYGGRGET